MVSTEFFFLPQNTSMTFLTMFSYVTRILSYLLMTDLLTNLGWVTMKYQYSKYNVRSKYKLKWVERF